MKEITIECEGASSVEWEKLKILQGYLKELSTANYNKLKKEIIFNGFSAPFFVWEGYIVDGTQRFITLSKMKKEGFIIPDKLPIVNIKAKNEAHARKKLLSFTSQYGTMTPDGPYNYMNESKIMFKELEERFEFDAISFESFEDEYFKDSEPDEANGVTENEEKYGVLPY